MNDRSRGGAESQRSSLLSLAAVGMALYGVYSVGLGIADLLGVHRLDWWADLGLVVLGLLLLLSAAFVRVLMPGGVAMALGALLGLQALSLHNDLHFYGAIVAWPQALRGVFGVVLVGLAMAGGQRPRPGR
jgi:hypothetical protein